MKKGALTLSRQRPLIGGLIFVFTFLVFWFSPIREMSDSKYAMLASQTLLRYHTLALDRYSWPELRAVDRSGLGANTTVYQIEQVRGHLFYYFPPAAPVLSVPYVALMNGLGISATNPDGSYNPEGELRIQAGLAALLMAMATSIFFYVGTCALPPGWAAVIAVGGSLGTQVWSTASRVMWSDTWALLLGALVVWLLLRAETGRRWTRLSASILATVLAWSYFSRPTNAITIVAITIYLIALHREAFLTYALTGAAWGALFVGYSWHNFGLLLPYYFHANRIHFGQYWEALAGNLISPSRGLLIFVPVLFFVGFLLLRYWKQLFLKRLAVLALVIAFAHLLTVSAFVPWNGGGCFGPRYTTALVPWFVLLTIPGVRTMREQNAKGYRWQLTAGAVLLLLSVSINARGALAYETLGWNSSPVSVDVKESRVWEWSYPQFLAGLINPPRPSTFPRIDLNQKIDLTSHEADKFLWYGWSGPEKDFPWTSARDATIVFAMDKPIDLTVKIRVAPFLVPGKVDRQVITATINGKASRSFVLDQSKESELRLSLPVNDLQQQNVLRLSLPNARSPQSLGVSSDSRRLGIAASSIVFANNEPPSSQL